MRTMSDVSTSRPMAISLLPLPSTSRCACGIYVMAQEEQCGVVLSTSLRWHSVQMDDISQPEIPVAFYGYGIPALVSWRPNARLATF